MTESRERSEWSRTASLMALVANVNRDPKKRRTFRPEDFNPYASRDRSAELARRKRPKAALTVLRDIWCRRA